MAKASSSKPQQTRMMVLMGVLVVVAVIALVKGLGSDRLSRTGSSAKELSYSRKSLPTLVNTGLDRPSAVDTAEHRNPFTFGKPPTPTPNLTPKPTKPPRIRPTPRPVPTRTPTPVGWKGPPPPFDRVFIGHFGPKRLQVAAFRKESDEEGISLIEVAVVGDILDNSEGEPIFIVREIGYESVLIGFVGWDSSEDERVPLAEE